MNDGAKRQVRVGVGVIVEHEGRILIGRRLSEHAHGAWGFPGGHLEHGETPEDCAAREVLEETGMAVENARRYVYTNDVFPDTGRHYITLFVACTPAPGQTPRNMEPGKCAGWEWRAPGDLPRPLMMPIVNLLKDGHSLTPLRDGVLSPVAEGHSPCPSPAGAAA